MTIVYHKCGITMCKSIHNLWLEKMSQHTPPSRLVWFSWLGKRTNKFDNDETTLLSSPMADSNVTQFN
jgi:hypothetical protein